MGQRARRGVYLGEIDRVGVPALGRGQGRSKGVTLLQHNMQDQILWDARDLYYDTTIHLEHPSQLVAILAFSSFSGGYC